MIDIGHSQRVGSIFRIRLDFADTCHIDWFQPAGNSHLVQVGVGYKRKQARMLVLPAESADTSVPGSLQNRDLNSLALNHAVAESRMVVGDIDECVVVNRLDKAVAQCVQHGSKSADIL